MYLKVELCADELVVGGGVEWSYDGRRRRAAHFSSAAAWLYRRRRRRQRRQTADERAVKQRTRWTGVFSGFTGLATSPVISAGLLAPKT